MKIRSPKRLAAKILVLFMALSVVPALFFGARLVLMASSHLDKDVNVWTKLEPAYAEHARTFHDGMKERLRKEIASFALYGSFIAAAAALFASGLLLRPLRKLTEGGRHIGSGNLHYRLPVQGNDEFAALSRAFNAMADSLQKRNDELGKKFQRGGRVLSRRVAPHSLARAGTDRERLNEPSCAAHPDTPRLG